MTRVFHFHQVWSLEADSRAVYGVLADADRYAVWWPQVRTIERIDAESGRATVRSMLPYTLHLVLRREIEDPATGVLRISVAGDLQGWCQWLVRDRRPGTLVVFDQEAIVTPALLARTVALTAPLLYANHAWMMRGGRAGLAAYLATRRG